TQIIAMVLSADPEQDPASLAVVGAGAALAISDIPFAHVLGGVRVGLVDGRCIANPTYSEARESKINSMVAGTEGGIVMVEAGAQQVSEADVLKAIEYGHECCRKITNVIQQMVKLAGRPKRTLTPLPVNKDLLTQLEDKTRNDLPYELNTEKYR